MHEELYNNYYICTELQRRTQRLRLQDFTLPAQESTSDSAQDEDTTTPADITAATPTAARHSLNYWAEWMFDSPNSHHLCRDNL